VNGTPYLIDCGGGGRSSLLDQSYGPSDGYINTCGDHFFQTLGCWAP
jgi:hypothetical protein